MKKIHKQLLRNTTLVKNRYYINKYGVLCYYESQVDS